MMSPIGRLAPSRNTVRNLDGLSVETGDLPRTIAHKPAGQATAKADRRASSSQRLVESFRYRQRSIVPLLARGVSAKDLPGHCAGDLRPFAQFVSLCLPQLPLPEKIAMLKRSHHTVSNLGRLELR